MLATLPLPYPQVWARYAARWKAIEDMELHTFGHANWAVYEWPDPEWPDYPWVLVDLGWED